MQIILKTKKLDERAVIPTRNNPTDAGLDLYALEDTNIEFGSIAKIRTGIAIELPYGTVGLILDRSSLGSKGLKVFGGVIDSDYRGEIQIFLGYAVENTDMSAIAKEFINDELSFAYIDSLKYNFSYINANETSFEPTSIQPYKLKAGSKVAQLVILPILLPIPYEVNELTDTERGDKGFGSSGE